MRQPLGSCRSGVSVHLLSSNGTLVPVKASISHHPGALGQGAMWAVSFQRSSEAALADERRLQLHVKVDGTIVAASRGTPQPLFGWDPARLVGQRLDAVVDVFRDYAKGGERLPRKVHWSLRQPWSDAVWLRKLSIHLVRHFMRCPHPTMSSPQAMSSAMRCQRWSCAAAHALAPAGGLAPAGWRRRKPTQPRLAQVRMQAVCAAWHARPAVTGRARSSLL